MESTWCPHHVRRGRVPAVRSCVCDETSGTRGEREKRRSTGTGGLPPSQDPVEGVRRAGERWREVVPTPSLTQADKGPVAPASPPDAVLTVEDLLTIRVTPRHQLRTTLADFLGRHVVFRY